jgi:hypothetical protein
MLVGGALMPSLAFAEIYKCVQDGKTVYQDHPCRGAGSAVVVSTPETSGAGAAATGADERLSRLRANVNDMARKRRKREIGYEIAALQREIKDYEQAETVELAALTDKMGFTFHNLNAAAWQRESVLQGIELEMRSVAEKYAALKQSARDRVSRLQKEVGDIDKPPADVPTNRPSTR